MRSFWDGHTDYRTKMTDDEENEKLEDFANWIEQDDSPVSSTNVKLLCTVEFTTLFQLFKRVIPIAQKGRIVLFTNISDKE